MTRSVKIGIIGDFDPLCVPHAATNAALDHAAARLGVSVAVSWVPTPTLEDRPAARLDGFDGLWCSPGSPYQSMEGALAGIRFARESRWPFFAT
jgi:CTP synthase (UTP-ammonia lyase)